MLTGKRIIYSFLCLAFVWSVFGLSIRAAVTPRISSTVQPGNDQDTVPQQRERILEDNRLHGQASVMRSVKMGDSTVIILVGNVVFYHNGVIITCDSAVRYNQTMMTGYDNVIVNRGTTYIYGDRIDYNSETKLAGIHSPLVKTLDKDAVLYTYNMTFNTDDNVGYFTGGGTMLQDSNRMEADRGYYYADSRELVAVGNVQLQNPDYDLISDSVKYVLDEETAYFSTRTYIWSKDGNFLTAMRGSYDTRNNIYAFTKDSYIMTSTREIWADTVHYEQELQNAILINDIQIVDTVQRAMAFGDFARYWGESQNALLTRNPSLVSYDETDTLYMRSDSMFMYSFKREQPTSVPDSLDGITGAAEFASVGDSTVLDGIGESRIIEESQGAVENTPTENVLAENAPAENVLTGKELRRQQKEDALQAELIKKLAAREAKRLETEEKRLQKQLAAQERKKERLALKESILSGEYLHDHDEDEDHDESAPDSNAAEDSVLTVEIPVLTGHIAQEEHTQNEQDSMLRVFKAYNGVKLYRTDFQAVCDSMIGFSVDSTLHMYVDPLIWNEENQIQSSYIDIYTKNQKIERAEFFGNPIMSSEIDSIHYDQIQGRQIVAYFIDGNIRQADVTGNGQTYYYNKETDILGTYVNMFTDMICADMSFFFDKGELNHITWRRDPKGATYPMDKIPADHTQRLPDFKWFDYRRPGREDVFTRNIRPSQREIYEALERPGFPVTADIKALKEQLLSGSWVDRTDPISPMAREYVDNLLNNAGVR